MPSEKWLQAHRQELRDKKNAKYKYRKEHGLCVQCAKPNNNGHSYCDECLEKSRDQQKANYRYKKSTGHCIKCGEPAIPGSPYCAVCREKDLSRKEAKRKLLSEEEKEDLRAYHTKKSRERRENLRSEGLCIYCAKRPPQDGFSTCLECRLEARNKKSSKGGKSKKKPDECRRCSEKALPGYHYCEKHLKEIRKSAAYARTFHKSDLIRTYLDADAAKAKWEKENKK